MGGGRIPWRVSAVLLAHWRIPDSTGFARPCDQSGTGYGVASCPSSARPSAHKPAATRSNHRIASAVGGAGGASAQPPEPRLLSGLD